MSSPVSSSTTCYADRAQYHEVTVVENVSIARDTYRIRFDCPELAQTIRPGQFVMLRLCGLNDPLLARPFALYKINHSDQGEPVGIEIVYLVLGKMTRHLTSFMAGQKLTVLGPLGNGFKVRSTQHLIMVVGGIGQTPMLSLAEAYLAAPQPPAVTLCYGARNASYLAGIPDFQATGIEVKTSTDDGSAGHHGLVTDLLRETIGESSAENKHIVCCGPERMMEAVSQIAAETQVSCEVSLETPMACGIGICFSCVAKVLDDDGTWDYRRTCVEGPVFDASRLVW